MKKSLSKEAQIDELNYKLWNERFGDNKTVTSEAINNLTRSKKLNYSKGIAYASLNIAALNFYQSRTDLAQKYLSESFHWFEENTNEKGYLRALLLKGNIHESYGDYEKTLTLWLEAYKVSKESGDREQEAESCSQLGMIYYRLCNFTKALSFLEKGLAIREELEDENGAASSHNRIGMVLRQMKRFDEALDHYSESLEIRKKNRQYSAIPWTMLGIASTYEEIGKLTEALENYTKGLEGSDKRCTLQCMMGSGRIYSQKGNSRKALKMLRDSLKMAQELKAMSLVADAYSALSNHYESSGDAKNALHYNKLYYQTRDLVQNEETQNKLRNIEIAHAVEKSEQEKEIYRLRNVELKEAYDIIEENDKEITASINYASRIQKALLPAPEEIEGLDDNYFILYKPKDIVSGDFYWFNNSGDKLIAVAGDCTGHGVPGALMSMLGISLLDEIVNYREITEPGKILDELRKEIQKALRQKGKKQEAKDGMDISICSIDRISKLLQYSGAYNNLYLVRNGELSEYHADKMPIAVFDQTEKCFTTYNIEIFPDDIIYMFSDGYADQFGGPYNKKYKYSSLRTLLLSINDLPMQTQQNKLEEEFLAWKGTGPQIDDILIMGIKI
jgi:serine phosphatase RsbU (regulator of sigma subunit)